MKRSSISRSSAEPKATTGDLLPASGSGVAGSGDDHLATLAGPLSLPLALIDEDPQQPRTADNPGFSKKSLSELATSIGLRGIKTPISVREHPGLAGRYLVNHGARRLRGARLAGLQCIPAFIDNDYSEADQVIENLHRNELTAREIADFIGRELAKGKRKGEVASMLSKSPAFVSQHAALLDLPEPMAKVFGVGRVRDVTLLNELLAAYKLMPAAVERWLADEQQEITRGTVRMLRAFLSETSRSPALGEGELPVRSKLSEDEGQASASATFHGTVQVVHRGSPAYLLLRRRPAHATSAWVRYIADGGVAEVPLSELVLVALLDGTQRTG